MVLRDPTQELYDQCIRFIPAYDHTKTWPMSFRLIVLVGNECGIFEVESFLAPADVRQYVPIEDLRLASQHLFALL